MKKEVFALSLMLLLIVNFAIACSSSESSIIGKWINEDYEGEYVQFDFFDDGTVAIFCYVIAEEDKSRSEKNTYSIADNLLTIENANNEINVSEFKIRGRKLTITNRNGESISLTKQ